MNKIVEILKKDGPLLSGILAKKLVKLYNMTEVAARQSISRSQQPIMKLKKIKFDNNQSFLYLQEQYRSPEYYERLFDYMKNQSKAYFSIIKAILLHNGYINSKHLPSYTFSPIKNLKGHRNVLDMIEDLEYLGLITDSTIQSGDTLYQLNDAIQQGIEVNANYPRYKGLELAKSITMEYFMDWSRKINLTAYNSGKIFSDVPEFFKFQWGFTCPSYINGLIKNSKFPCFVVADIIIGKSIEEEDIEFFIQKNNILKSVKGISPYIPVLIIEKAEKEAFKILKENGIVIGLVNELFGNTYSEMLSNFINIVENASAIIAKNPDQYFKLIDQLKKLEGKSINIKGTLFELAVAYYYSGFSKFLEIGKLILEQSSGKQREIDIFIKISSQEFKVVECKGVNSPLDKDTVQKWLNDKVPVIRKWFLSIPEYEDKKLSFEIWSTGGFDCEAEEILKKAVSATKKYQINYYNKNDIVQIAKDHHNQKLKEIINEFFTNL